MRVEKLVESKEVVLALSDLEAAGLQALGRQLASEKTWWGAASSDTGESEATAIHCIPRGAGQWAVAVDNAVGTVATGDVQLVIGPKIAPSHLLYLFSQTNSWPALDEALAPLGTDDSLMELVARWFLTATERLLRGDLLRDYYETRDDLEAVRGRIDVLGTAGLFYSGRLAARCDYDVFDIDTPLNRVLKAAARAILRDPTFAQTSRKRAEKLVLRMDDIGSLEQGDLRTGLDRRTVSYRGPFLLARQVLLAEGRALAAGDVSARAFLIRTPDLVEDGIRDVLAEALVGACVVKKEGRRLENSTMTINPDLRFDPVAVGDVKYKVNWDPWPRADLYQSVAFAAGFRRREAVVVSFCKDTRPNLELTGFGDIAVRHLQWRAIETLKAERAKEQFARDARAWWDSIAPIPEASTLSDAVELA